MHITSIDITKYTSLGSADYPAYSLFDSIKEVVAYRISPEASALFCEPIFDVGVSEIDYASLLDGNPLPLDDLDVEEKNATLDKLAKISAEIEALAKTFTSSNDPDNVRFGRNLRDALCVPSSRHIYTINNQPVLTAWGFKNRGATDAFDTVEALQLKVDSTENSVKTVPTHSEVSPIKKETLVLPQRNRKFPWWYLPLFIGGILLLLLLLSLLFGDSDAKKKSSLSQASEVNMGQPTSTPVSNNDPESGTPAPAKASNPVLRDAPTTKINTTEQKSVQVDSLNDSSNDLHIPAEAIADGDVSFLAGKWVSITGLTSSVSKKNVLIYYMFDAQGVGTKTIVHEQEGLCTAQVKAEFRELKHLYIEDQTDVFCPSTTYFPKSTVVCDVAERGEAVCRGYQDNNHYEVSFKRSLANEALKTGEPPQAHTPSFTGKLVKVLDGDTVEVMHDGKAERIRLAQIDCPEKSQPFGQAAKQYVLDIAALKVVTVQVETVDRYGRTVGEVSLPDGANLNKQIVGAGYAWQYKRYSKDPAYSELETGARVARLGLWQDKNPVPPWEWRKGKR